MRPHNAAISVELAAIWRRARVTRVNVAGGVTRRYHAAGGEWDMTRIYRFGVPRHEVQADMDRQTGSLAALALLLALVVAGLFLIRTLRAEAKAEDCMMSGRSACDVMPQHPLSQGQFPWVQLPQAW